MKKRYQFVSVLLLTSTLCWGQAKYWAINRRLYPVDTNRAHCLQLSIGVGISAPTKEVRNSINALRTKDLLASAYLPMGTHQANRRERITYGLHIGFTYALSVGNYTIDPFSAYRINGQRLAPSLTVGQTGSTSNVLYRIELGPQINLHIAKLTLSPIVSVGFVRFRQDAFAVVQNTLATNTLGVDTAVRINLYEQANVSSNGVALLPKLRLGYALRRLSFWVEGQYTWGPSIEREATFFVPQGTANPVTGDYSLNQIQAGTREGTGGQRVNYQSWGIRIGGSWKIRCLGSRPKQRCTCK